jgi:tetratricopeptide (TPR) repeat protein
MPQSFVPREADDGRALYIQGLLALRQGDADRAVRLLGDALRVQPGHRGIGRNLVRALLAAGQFEAVLEQVCAALTVTPDVAELYFARGTALNALGHPARACAAFGRALSLRPDHAPSWLNMGNASADLDDLASAETLYRTAIRLDPALPEAHASLGHVLTMQGRIPDAIEACAAAIRLRPDFAPAHWNLAVAALLGGDLTRGFTAYEWRKRHDRYRADFPDLPGDLWGGSDITGKTILVRAEQGFGDTIQFARYLPLIRDTGATPILLCAGSLVPLFQSIDGVRAVSVADRLPAYDVRVDLMSLPHLFGTTLDTIPSPGAYLTADPVRTEVWRGRLPAGRRVGIAFAGHPGHPNDRRRSIQPEDAVRLLDVPGVSFVNLLHGPAAGGFGLTVLTPWLSDYADTAALIDALDIVVTVDTSVAHLAGALGKPVWILLPYVPDWRWLLGRTDSPWYRSARLFRQPVQGDWASVLARVRRDLTLGG